MSKRYTFKGLAWKLQATDEELETMVARGQVCVTYIDGQRFFFYDEITLDLLKQMLDVSRTLDEAENAKKEVPF